MSDFITPLQRLDRLERIFPSGENQNTVNSQGTSPFQDVLRTAVNNLKATDTIDSENTALLATGDIDDLHQIGIDATKAYLAEALVVELRNRAMDAYSEIMRISI